MPRLQGRRVLWLLGLALVVALGIERAATLAHAAPSDFDDAYMYLRYAKHVLAGHGVCWNVGEGNVYGVTSLLHLGAVIVAVVFFPRLSAEGTLQVVSGAAALAFLAALVTLATLVCRDRRLRGNEILWASALVPLVAFSDSFVFHAGTGMDTMLSALANTAVVLAALQLARAPNATSALWTALASFLAMLARPDNVVGAVLSPALALFLLAKAPRRRASWVFAVTLLAAVVVLIVATTKLLGSPVPLSFFAKQPGYYRDFAGEYGWNPYRFLRVFAEAASPFAVAVLIFAERASWRRLLVLLAPPTLTIAVLFSFNQIMGHMGRFYYPFLPFFVAAGVLELDSWMARRRELRSWLVSKSTLVRVAAVVACVPAGSLALSVAANAYDERAERPRSPVFSPYSVPAAEPLPDVDSWAAAKAVAALAAAAPAGTSFAMSEHGLPGALAPDARIVDVLGLHDPYVARHGFSASELFRRNPDVLWLPHPDHAAMLQEILGSDELWNRYDYFPDGFFYGIALRLDSPNYGRLQALFRQHWRALYAGLEPDAFRAKRLPQSIQR